ncbi:MAG: branched-chain amino acid ABC transporter permease, partial [Acidimicrobiia bacterium]|nr:branched-chain amino acid ABC transporter permease [Acidimicrobiia bacterium]
MHGGVLRLVAVGTVVVGFVLTLAGPVWAQDEEGGDPEAAQSIGGTLTATNEENERNPVPGVLVRVLDADGNEIGSATSGDDGVFLIGVLDAGSYVAELDDSTLPDGFSLRNPDRNPLAIDLVAGQSRNVIFAINEGAGAGGSEGDPIIDRLARLSVEGLKFGLIIAMTSIGLSLIFGTTGLTNFAHGEMVTFGALIALALNDPDVLGMQIIPAGAIAVALTAAIGAAQELGLWRPLRNRGTGLIAMLVVSIGLSIVWRYVMLYQAGGRNIRYQDYSLQTDGLELGPVTIVPRDFWVMGISIVVLVVVAVAISVTRLGKAMRAVSDNRDLAESSGIDVQRVILLIWVIGGGLAGLGGVLFGLDQGASWDMGFELLLL